MSFEIQQSEELLKIQELLEDLEDLQDLRTAQQEEQESPTFSLDEVKQILIYLSLNRKPRNRVSESPQSTEKPGFCNNLCFVTER